ncbi:MAG TPA: hypothetical protein P5323_00175 [Candidatus Moranbacteria bacterium]|nr:hypothetical protein [Candidatus Moranbacteria bacterium]HRY27541.1 hypothetical protein [Candidatus Moranbacteria bacterium]HSA07770.1 hypothetical protein [Candidatus Moranbacteria bacterium]
MKSLERRFKNITKKKPFWSSYVCFSEAVKGQGFNRQSIHRWFQRLVDKNDYTRKEKRAILAHLENITVPLRTTGIEGKNEPQQVLNHQAYN